MAQRWRDDDRSREDDRSRYRHESHGGPGYGRRGDYEGAGYGGGYSQGSRGDEDEYRERWSGEGGGRGYDPYGSGGPQRRSQSGGRQAGGDFGMYEPDVNRYSGGRSGYGGSGRGGERGERGMWERAGDEVASWFGDEDAERRREMDAAREGRHRGRGPKGYARSDDRIREDVSDRLSDDGMVDASDIEVAVSNREVTLSGTVDSRAARRRAEDCAEAVSGVSYVQNNLRVKETGSTGLSGSGGLAGMGDAGRSATADERSGSQGSSTGR